MPYGNGPYGSAPYGGLALNDDLVLTGEDATSSGILTDTVDADVRPPPNLDAGASVADGNDSTLLDNLRARLTLRDALATSARSVASLASAGRFAETVGIAWQMVLSEEAVLSDSEEATVRQLVGIAETITAISITEGRLSAYAAVAVAAALEGKVSSGWSGEVIDQAELADGALSVMRALLAAASAAEVADGSAGGLRLTLVTQSGAAVQETPEAALSALAELGDGASLYCSLRLDGNDYQGWAVNGDLLAVTEYRNVPFDSIELHDGKTYAAGVDGIYELAGDTDDGQPIDAWVRSFLIDFGTQRFKRAPDIWIGLRADGGMFVKVHTRDPDSGAAYEDWYAVEKKQGAGSAPGRAKVGRGLESTWWGLSLANVNGADFAVDKIEWRPLVSDRRQ